MVARTAMSRSPKRLSDLNDIRKLLRLYRANECLWNPKSHSFHNAALRENAWQRLARCFNNKLTVDQLKLQILSLRYYFATELVAIKRSKLRGYHYIPRYSYFEELEFLKEPMSDNINLKAIESTVGSEEINCIVEDAFLLSSSENSIHSEKVDYQLPFTLEESIDMLKEKYGFQLPPPPIEINSLRIRAASGNDRWYPTSNATYYGDEDEDYDRLETRDKRPTYPKLHKQNSNYSEISENDRHSFHQKQPPDISKANSALDLCVPSYAYGPPKRKVLTGKYRSRPRFPHPSVETHRNEDEWQNNNEFRNQNQPYRVNGAYEYNQHTGSSRATYRKRSGDDTKTPLHNYLPQSGFNNAATVPLIQPMPTAPNYQCPGCPNSSRMDEPVYQNGPNPQYNAANQSNNAKQMRSQPEYPQSSGKPTNQLLPKPPSEVYAQPLPHRRGCNNNSCVHRQNRARPPAYESENQPIQQKPYQQPVQYERQLPRNELPREFPENRTPPSTPNDPREVSKNDSYNEQYYRQAPKVQDREDVPENVLACNYQNCRQAAQNTNYNNPEIPEAYNVPADDARSRQRRSTNDKFNSEQYGFERAPPDNGRSPIESGRLESQRTAKVVSRPGSQTAVAAVSRAASTQAPDENDNWAPNQNTFESNRTQRKMRRSEDEEFIESTTNGRRRTNYEVSRESQERKMRRIRDEQSPDRKTCRSREVDDSDRKMRYLDNTKQAPNIPPSAYQNEFEAQPVNQQCHPQCTLIDRTRYGQNQYGNDQGYYPENDQAEYVEQPHNQPQRGDGKYRSNRQSRDKKSRYRNDDEYNDQDNKRQRDVEMDPSYAERQPNYGKENQRKSKEPAEYDPNNRQRQRDEIPRDNCKELCNAKCSSRRGSRSKGKYNECPEMYRAEDPYSRGADQRAQKYLSDQEDYVKREDPYGQDQRGSKDQRGSRDQRTTKYQNDQEERKHSFERRDDPLNRGMERTSVKYHTDQEDFERRDPRTTEYQAGQDDKLNVPQEYSKKSGQPYDQLREPIPPQNQTVKADYERRDGSYNRERDNMPGRSEDAYAQCSEECKAPINPRYQSDGDDYGKIDEAYIRDKEDYDKQIDDKMQDCFCPSDEEDLETLKGTDAKKEPCRCEAAVETDIDMTLNDRQRLPTHGSEQSLAGKPMDVPNTNSYENSQTTSKPKSLTKSVKRMGKICSCKPAVLNKSRQPKSAAPGTKTENLKNRSASPALGKQRFLSKRHNKLEDDGLNKFQALGGHPVQVVQQENIHDVNVVRQRSGHDGFQRSYHWQKPNDGLALLCSFQIPPTMAERTINILHNHIANIPPKIEENQAQNLHSRALAANTKWPFRKPKLLPRSVSYTQRSPEYYASNPFRNLNFNASKREVIVLHPPVPGFRASKNSFNMNDFHLRDSPMPTERTRYKPKHQ